MTEEVIYAPLGRWLPMLAAGWKLNLGWRGVVVEPMAGSHGEYSVLMWRETTK